MKRPPYSATLVSRELERQRTVLRNDTVEFDRWHRDKDPGAFSLSIIAAASGTDHFLVNINTVWRTARTGDKQYLPGSCDAGILLARIEE